MSEIPSELYHDILTYVPMESLARFRVVCKEWRQIIDDPTFAKSHVDRQGDGDYLIIRNTRNLYQRKRNTRNLYLMSLDSLCDSKIRNKTLDATNSKITIPPRVPNVFKFPLSSCHGLMLISSSEIRKNWALWNPFTRKFFELPKYKDFTHVTKKFMLYSGLGYDSATNDYKVVRIAQLYHPRLCLETFIYSLNANKWKRIQDTPRHLSPALKVDTGGIFINGALYWIARERQLGQDVEHVIALDISTETYSTIPLPPSFQNYRDCQKHLYYLGGCLLLSCYFGFSNFDVWELQNNSGGGNMWTKLFSLFHLVNIKENSNPKIVAYFKSKDLVVIQDNNKKFLLFDLKRQRANKVKIEGMWHFTSQVLPASLVRLGGSDTTAKSIALGEKAKRKLALETSRTRKKRKIMPRVDCRLKLQMESTEGSDYEDLPWYCD